ncbi:MAG: small subunit ribosomal protein S5 [Parcubacteria group bacterium Gr01-1014_17]|nr:MAG: small subunit ribosomal protein S5 [Parcubacteria group bacterium Gr01-1014_17]
MSENQTEQKMTRPPRGGDRARRQRPERARPEFDEKLLALKRVARVAAGGRRFNFSAAVVVGNRRGAVGVAVGKGVDTALAMEKATRSARKYAVRPFLTQGLSISHEVRAKYSSAIVEIRPAPGRGLVAGSAVRAVLELAGVRDVSAKVLSGSKNKLNIAQATIKALSTLQKPRLEKSIPPPLPLTPDVGGFKHRVSEAVAL